MKKKFMTLLFLVLIVTIYFLGQQYKEIKQLKQEIGSLYFDYIRDAEQVLLDVSRTNWSSPQLTEDELTSFVVRLSDLPFYRLGLSSEWRQLNDEIEQIIEWIVQLRDEGQPQESKSLTHNADVLAKLMEDFRYEIKDEEELYESLYTSDEEIKELMEQELSKLK